MLITKYLKAVILTTYLVCSLSHMVQSRYMIVKEDQMLDRADTQLSSASITTGTIQSSLIPSNPVHHKHRHNHNIENNQSISSFLPPSLLSNLLTFDKKTSRDFLLYNRCSGHYLNILGKSINAKSEENNQYSLMSIETQTYGTRIGIRILSKNAGVYLCFNKKGKLITRYNGANIGCLFTEILHASRYIKFNSLYNPDWNIGFNKNGRPISGKIRNPNQHIKKEKCYHFVKKSQNIFSSLDSSHETYNNHRNINSYNLKAGPLTPKTPNPNVINTRNTLRSKNNEKSLHLMSAMSPASKSFFSREMRTNSTETSSDTSSDTSSQTPSQTSSETIISHNQNSIHRRKVEDKSDQQNDFKSRINVNYNHDYKINHNNNHNRDYHSEHHQPLR